MSWRKVTEDDLVSSLAGAELDAFRRSSATDPVDPLIRATVAYVRGVIRSAPTRVKMNADEDTLPDSLIIPAMHYLRFSILMRMNQEANASRTKAYEDAVNLFREIRAGQYVPESDGASEGRNDIAGSPASGNQHPPRLLD